MKRFRLLAVACVLALSAACSAGITNGSSTDSEHGVGGGTSSTPPASSVPTNSSSTLTVAETTPPATLDPIASSLDTSEYAWQLCYEGLLTTSANGQVQPMLATSWTESTDGLTYTFALRKDVTFANGDRLTAEDVVFSFDRLLKSGIPFSQNRLSSMKSVTAPDPETVVFKLSTRDPGFLNIIADPLLAGTAILDKAWVATHDPKAQMMGTGPFEFVSYTPNKEMQLVRNPHYWNRGGAAKVAKLTILYMPQLSTQVAALKSGSVDLMFPDAVTHKELASAPSVVMHQVTSDDVLVLNLNTAKAPFNNVDVRRAVSLALNRDSIVQGAFLGEGLPSAQIPPSYKWAPDASGLAYQKQDLAKAKSLLAKAGYPDGLKVTLNHYAGYTSYMDSFSELVKSELAQIGITVTIEPNQQAVWLDKLNKPEDASAFSDNEYGYGADPYLYLQPRPGRQGPPPAPVANAIAQTKAAASVAEYQQALVNLLKVECEYVYPNIALAARNVWVATGKDIHGVSLDSNLSRRFLAAVTVG